MKTGCFAAAVVLVAGAFFAPGSAAHAQDFEGERLQAGRLAYQEKKYLEAIDQFRVAAFGSLDKPPVLSECLARLALAQAAAGKVSEADETLNRFLEIERRFQVFSKANLEPETRSDFRTLLARRIPGASLAAAPAQPAPGESAAPRSKKPPSAQVLSEGRRLIAASKPTEAERILNQGVIADPGNRDLRLALLEASCLGRAFPTAAAQVPLVAPLNDSEAQSMAYAAVALYETGRKDEARDYMQRAGSKASGPLVDEYSRKILGRP